MQLRVARVCLDCEEVHDAQQCPMCASEMFAFLTKWVPVDERRASRPPSAPAPERVPANATERWVKRGVAGVALLAASQWIWRASRSPAGSGETGEKPPERRS
jgi:hypothetical protein